jgi:hypothetical protein
METAHHLLSSCRYSRRVWTMVALWLGHENLLPNNWAASATALHRWININTTIDTPRQGTCSLTMLVMWELWLERNARVFDRFESSVRTVVAKIKSEVTTWIVAGVKGLAALSVHVNL